MVWADHTTSGIGKMHVVRMNGRRTVRSHLIREEDVEHAVGPGARVPACITWIQYALSAMPSVLLGALDDST